MSGLDIFRNLIISKLIEAEVSIQMSVFMVGLGYTMLWVVESPTGYLPVGGMVMQRNVMHDLSFSFFF